MTAMRIPPIDEINDTLSFCVSGGADFAEIFFESTLVHGVVCEEGRVERLTSGIDEGFGLRLIAGDRTAYGYSNRIDGDELRRIGRGVLAELGGGAAGTAVRAGEPLRSIADVAIPADGVPAEKKVAVVLAADRAARAAGCEVSQAQITCRDLLSRIAVFNSEGTAARDERRQFLFAVRAIASDGAGLQAAYRSRGGRVGFE
ncbi:MAG TPA: hypothetical protein ENO23_02300, partial [Alphaproteobacteria bacterium]|nr:hypothetical protein [Alphaproteobacteria bacterium]